MSKNLKKCNNIRFLRFCPLILQGRFSALKSICSCREKASAILLRKKTPFDWANRLRFSLYTAILIHSEADCVSRCTHHCTDKTWREPSHPDPRRPQHHVSSLVFVSGYGTNTLSGMTKATLDPHSHLRQPGE